TEPLKHGAAVLSAQFSPDGRRVVTASRDNNARVWDAGTGLTLGEPLKHGDDVSSAQFSPDGQRVVTASDDNTARLWHVPTSPLPIPRWLLQLAEAVVGQRLNDQGIIEVVSGAEFVR